jgi:hypothetical protein
VHLDPGQKGRAHLEIGDLCGRHIPRIGRKNHEIGVLADSNDPTRSSQNSGHAAPIV